MSNCTASAISKNIDKEKARDRLGLGNSSTKNVTTSTANPSGGSDGDVWLKVEMFVKHSSS